MRVAIAGGGLAGLTCAKYLADAGHSVGVYEGLPFLGGRASTYKDADGDWVEQGLHLFLGVYSELKTLLREIGRDPDQDLLWMSEVRLREPHGPHATYGVNPVTSPFKTVLSVFGQNDYLGVRDKVSMPGLIAPAILPLDSLREQFDHESVVTWWRRSGGTETVLERFIRPFCRAIQFTDAEDFSAFNFLAWIHHITYDLSHSYLGGYRGARDELFFQPLARYILERGATIRTGVKLEAIDYASDAAGNGGVTGFTLDGGERVEADAYVVAVPAWAVGPLLPPALRDEPFFAGIAKLPVAPAISVQLWFDRPVVNCPDFTLVPHSVTPVYQDQSDNAYPWPRGSRISVIISPADDLLGQTDQQLIIMTIKSLQAVEPLLAEAGIVKSVVLRHEKHLIRPLPRAMSARPLQVTPVPNMFLAGDWTQQDFFGSQEGAVRGGKACAQAILSRSAS